VLGGSQHLGLGGDPRRIVRSRFFIAAAQGEVSGDSLSADVKIRRIFIMRFASRMLNRPAEADSPFPPDAFLASARIRYSWKIFSYDGALGSSPFSEARGVSCGISRLSSVYLPFRPSWDAAMGIRT